MTLKEAAKGVVHAGLGIYDIGFNDGDETQLDAYGMNDLNELWEDFCKENDVETNSVDYVEKA